MKIGIIHKTPINRIKRFSFFLFVFLVFTTDILAFSQEKNIDNLQFKSLDTALNLAELKLNATLEELAYNSTLHPAHTDRVTGKWDSNHLSRNEWTSGFFSGSLWYMYKITGDESWSDYAANWTIDLEPVAHLSHDHDTGFRIFNSFGNGYKLVEQRSYYRTILRAASTLSKRYNSRIGAIKSWDWSEIGNFPVIIDNLMNLELLFWASEANEKWYEIARKHAEFTLNHHMRPDGSTYHIVDFTDDGMVIDKFTTQGCDSKSSGCGEKSVWARGQAWAIYGFTMIYRYTGEQQFLDAAIAASEYYIQHLPNDFIPIYDFFEPISSNRSKDTSSAAIAASGFFELYSFTENLKYFNTAVQILESLTTPEYSNIHTNSNSILRQTTIHRGFGNVGTSYADYYYLEAIVRYLELTGNVFPETEKMSTLFLDQNYPNPFNNLTTIFYSLENEGLADLSVYDISGRKIQTIIHESHPSGTHRAVFDGSGISSGVYFYVLRVNGDIITRKMTFLK